MKKILLPILSLILAACSSSQVAVTRSAQVTVTSSPPTAAPIPTPTLHPQFVEVQDQIAASGETFTLLPNGTLEQMTEGGAVTVPGLSVDKNGAITLRGDSSQVTISPEDVSFDDTNGVNVAGYTLDEATGLWRVEVTSLSIENLDTNKWGNYSFIENPDGYYEMKDFQGNLIPEVKLFGDGTAELTYSSKKLAVAFQAISIGTEDQLALGLWDFKNGEWTMAPGHTAEDVRSGEYASDSHKLVVIRGNEVIEKKLTDTIFTARDLYMNNTEGYRPESEFEDISVTVNFKTIDNFDVRPKEWMMQNFSRNFKVFGKTGVYRFSPSSTSNEVVYKDGSTLSYARPIQVELGNGWFRVERYDASNNLKDSLVHVPVVSMNTDRSINNMSALIKESDLPRLIPLLNKEDRGGIDIWLFSKTVAQMPAAILADTELMDFTAGINNSNFFDVIDEPKLDTQLTLKSLPKESSEAFLTLIIQTWY